MTEDNGMSLIDIWNQIMRKKIVFYIMFGVLSIAILCFLIFGFNPMNTSYQLEFNYDWYGLDKNTFADGKVFNYYDIISSENLEQAKDKNKSYSSIDIEKIADNIDIYRDQKNFKIVIKGNLFSNDKLAKSFLIDLISIPYEYALNQSFDFDANLVGYENSKKINDKINYLEKQISLMKTGYKGLIGYFGNVRFEDTNLQYQLENLEIFEANNSLSLFKNLVYKNTYLTKDEYLSLSLEQQSLETEQQRLKNKKETLFASIEAIYQTSQSPSSIDNALTNYLNSIHSIDLRLVEIDENLKVIEQANSGQYNEAQSNAFLSELDELKESIEEYSKLYSKAVENTLKQNTFMNISNFKISGRISLILLALISVISGLI
ncbi:MAG: hypothetical protein K2I77_04745, partial [Anaeroplasmataceae bacterium]|nr:hypothetical protein [Anaeroplasmataceae bacterium]